MRCASSSVAAATTGGAAITAAYAIAARTAVAAPAVVARARLPASACAGAACFSAATPEWFGFFLRAAFAGVAATVEQRVHQHRVYHVAPCVRCRLHNGRSNVAAARWLNRNSRSNRRTVSAWFCNSRRCIWRRLLFQSQCDQQFLKHGLFLSSLLPAAQPVGRIGPARKAAQATHLSR